MEIFSRLAAISGFILHCLPESSRYALVTGHLHPVASIGSASHCQPDTQDLIDIERLKGADMVLLDKRQAQAAPTRQVQAFAYGYMRGRQA
ncbi:hypothetical protein DQ393_00840 [Rhizobium tropici]|uniref:Uncharacterized protein n=1 Tax=Rhizobium tropici TaxID=398 RepID=A0A329YLS3_RHITR|nr:hypothetical protein DQ393_00840 [Rhizobium tropici]